MSISSSVLLPFPEASTPISQWTAPPITDPSLSYNWLAEYPVFPALENVKLPPTPQALAIAESHERIKK
ncbi:hypothetical protein NEOLEDRAFT_1138528 [Neolentinus lepideus HHB14362 ss-1]|uniref:Uncharacterized protein n=1 Tax=Neolentinus lepideus HHB14362 ss-1 TaxID=1314782 RepID=A0A165Q701_9AGAM|nr:hypothetical protein NEOLEDRAFT_1138528 [Neolentinus lepideus HHB14362 ss-1]